jgi:hypothetical protein
LQLPTTKRKPLTDLAAYRILIYGSPKIGKSTFCSQIEDVLFLDTENGLQALEVCSVNITSWNDFKSACGALKKGHSCKFVAIDTVDSLYRMCREDVLRRLGVRHESDSPYGKGYAEVKGEFTDVMEKVFKLPYGIILTSWSKMIEVKTRTDIFNKAVTTLPTAIQEFVTGTVDIILYAEVLHDGRRVIHANSSELHLGGDRTGRLPHTLPLDYSQFEIAFRGGEIIE